MKRKGIAVLILLALAALACRAGSVPRPGNYDLVQEFDGVERDVILHLPDAYDGETELPLLIALHGGAGRGAHIQRVSGLDAAADEYGFVVAYPNGSSQFEEAIFTWNSGHCCGYALEQQIDDVGFLAALIERLLEDYSINPQRVYLTGISNGGMMAYRAAAELSEQVAGIAPIAGTIGGQVQPGGETILPPIPQEPVAMIAFHGLLDQNVLYEGGHGERTLADRIDVPVETSIDFWLAANGCPGEFSEESQAGGNIIIRSYQGCAAGGEVVLVLIADGGHAWPGGEKGLVSDEPTQDISANEMMLEFFSNLAQ